MYIKVLVAGMLASTMILSTPALAVTISDPVGDFLDSYTAGPKLADLDVTQFSVDYDGSSQIFTLGASFAGNIDPQTAGLYVFGVNTGTGTAKPFINIGEPNVIFNQAIVIQKNGTGAIGSTQLGSGAVSISANTLTARIPLSLLPSTGFTPTQYGFNLWPRIGLGNNNQITDFAPENATLSVGAVPEPATWAMMILGLGAVGVTMRGRKKVATSLLRAA